MAPRQTKPKNTTAATEDDLQVGSPDDASHPNAVPATDAVEPGVAEKAEAKASDEQEQDIAAANEASTNGGLPVLVGDARHGKPVLYADPAGGNATLVEVDDPNRVVQSDGSVEPLQG